MTCSDFRAALADAAAAHALMTGPASPRAVFLDHAFTCPECRAIVLETHPPLDNPDFIAGRILAAVEIETDRGWVVTCAEIRNPDATLPFLRSAPVSDHARGCRSCERWVAVRCFQAGLVVDRLARARALELGPRLQYPLLGPVRQVGTAKEARRDRRG